jgi:large subunit ribosomal protein L7/L12
MEKKTFTVVLTSVGEKKITVIKILHDLLQFGLTEGAAATRETPSTIVEGASEELAMELKRQIESLGGTVELR